MTAPREETPRERLRIRAERAPAGVVVRVHGEIDAFTADALREQAIAATAPLARPRIVLDLDQVGFCDSSGLTALVAIWKAVRSRRGDLVVARPPEVCRRILARTRLDQHIGVSPTVRHALRRIASP
ncbi:STAS domain-containing protein [Actinomadura opuntiae]|uniref:STAS domain-containing protein n=1 Tax=Actinomadura sp. OS1-43 TaxID=604315 RepID=UPI00255AB953|nr:STAS domain-containing protein [Actinomadura sp. OS1-43]MDL4813737.1 STAS domain-containing protein [Actinomadura sp. OS1-43]